MGPVNNTIYMFSMMFIERQEAVNKNNAICRMHEENEALQRNMMEAVYRQ